MASLCLAARLGSSWARPACRLAVPAQATLQQLRGVTIRSSQAKLQESLGLVSTQKFREDKPDKPRLEVDPSRPQHLNDAHVRITEFSRRRDFEGGWAAFKEVQDPDDQLKVVALGLCAKALWAPTAGELWSSISVKPVSGYNTMIDLYARLKRSADAEALFHEMKRAGQEPNHITYTTLIKAFSNSGEPHKALEMFEAMQPLLAGAGDSAKQIAYQVVMAAFSRQGDYATTRELFVRMTQAGVPPDRGHYHSLMAACASRGDAETAQKVFDIMPAAGLPPDEQSYTVLISCCRFNLQRCRELIDEMTAAGLTPTSRTYGELLEAHVLARDGAGAKALIGKAQSLDVNSRKIRHLMRQVETM